MEVSHLCNEMGCLRLEHLEVVTRKQNAEYKGKSGRCANRFGRQKIDGDTAIAIRKAWRDPNRTKTQTEIAKDYGLSQQLVSYIVNKGYSWVS